MSKIVKSEHGKVVAPAKLTDTAKSFAKASKADNTRRAYAAQWSKWLAYCEVNGIDREPPARAEDVANWIAERASDGQSVSTLRTAVAAIKAIHTATGLQFDSTAPAIKMVMAGVVRQKGAHQKQAEPLRGLDVLEIVEACEATPRGKRDAALFALGYVFGLRRSELVALTWQQPGEGDGFVRITAKTIELTMLRSKTAGGKPEVVTVPRDANPAAVKAIEVWVEEAAIEPGSPLLRRVRKGGKVSGAMQGQSVALVIKSRVQEHFEAKGVPADLAKVEADKFSGHSLRVGFATTAAEAGADLRAIASVTRHASIEMPRRYAMRADQLKTSPHNLEGVGLDRRSL
ncbi:MAG: tyrosine-type recombinase/integrase [Filomicrobium sp.]